MQTKTCPRCNRIKPLNDFYRNQARPDGCATYCIACEKAYKAQYNAAGHAAEYQRKAWQKPERKAYNRRKTQEWYSAHPEQKKAQAAINSAVATGKITKPNTCSHCGRTTTRIEGHHPDHNKRLEVIWLCSRCHRLADRALITVMF